MKAKTAAEKRRQALRIATFLMALAVAVVAIFHWVHDESVAYRKGVQAHERREFAEASRWLEQAVAGGVKVGNARELLARTYGEMGRWREAQPHYEWLVNAGPSGRAHFDTLVGLYQALDEPERAIALYPPEGSRSGLDALGWVKLGDLYTHAGQFAEAAGCYRQASGQLPHSGEVWARLGIVLSWTGQWDEAGRALARALQVVPDHRLAHIYYARAATHAGRFAEAVEHYRKVLPP